MFIIQHSKTKLYAVQLKRNGKEYLQWHSRREYATRFKDEDTLECIIRGTSANKDRLMVIKDDG